MDIERCIAVQDSSRHFGVVEAAHEPVRTLCDGIQRQLLAHNDELMLCRVSFAAGAAGDVHRHPHAQVTYVESGRFVATIDGERIALGAGDSFHVGSNVDHGVTCLVAGVLVDAFAPAREDFIVQEPAA